MRIRILRPALEDLAAGRQFYERQKPGLGSDFFEHVFAEIDALAAYAGTHHVQHGFHRLLVRRFPYAVYYRLIGNEAVVFRVLDCRRDPAWIHRSLGE